MELGLASVVSTNPLISRVIHNLAEMAGIGSKTIAIPMNLVVKIKYKNKTRVLSRNPTDFNDLQNAIFKCFPDLENNNDLSIHYLDDDKDKAFVADTNDLLAAYKLIGTISNKKVLQLTINSIDEEKSGKQVMGISSYGQESHYKPVEAKRLKIKIMNWEILENALLIRNGYIYEFVKSNKNWYGYKCADAKIGWLGRWYIYERDVAGYGLEHAAHTLTPDQHSSWKFNRDIARTALNIVPYLDMKGDLPYVVTYEQFKKVVMRLLEKDLRLSKDDLISWFMSLGTDWNLLAKNLIDNLIFKMRSRLAVKINDKNNLEDIKTFDSLSLGRKLLEIKIDDLKQYILFMFSPCQEIAMKEAKLLYFNWSYKQILKPQWKDIMFIHWFIDGLWVTVGAILFQTWTESIFKTAFNHLKDSLGLNIGEIIIDCHPELTSGAIQSFCFNTRFKTCSYFMFKFINERAHRLGLFDQGIDIHVNRLLKWLKWLAFKPKDKIVSSFTKIKDYFKRYWSTFHRLFNEFESIFIEKYNSEYWSFNYMLINEDSLSDKEEYENQKRRRDYFLQINMRLEINDKECILKWLKTAENRGQSGFSEAIANIERMSRWMIQEENWKMTDNWNQIDPKIITFKTQKQDDDTCKNAQLYWPKPNELQEYSILYGVLVENKDYIEEELSKTYSFPTEVTETTE